MLSPGERLANNGIKRQRPKTCEARRIDQIDVRVANQIILLDSDIEPFCNSARPRTAVNPQMSIKSSRREKKCSTSRQIKKDDWNFPERPATAAPKRQKNVITKSRKSSSDVPDSEDIENLKRLLKSARRPTIMWGGSALNTFNERIVDEWQTKVEPKRKTVIVDHEPIDINNPVAAAPLISTKALVQDYIGMPMSFPYAK